MSDDQLPFYAQGLDAFHEVADRELSEVLAKLPLGRASQVLDLGAGDGYFSRLLARAFPQLNVIAGDSSKAYREQCEKRNRQAGLEGRIAVRAIDATAVDVPDRSLAAVFCAYSFQSIPQHAEVLEECRRVLRPGGQLLLVETDGIHNWLLPLPTGLELRIRRAELEASGRSGQLEGWTFSRRCGRLLREHGFELREAHSFTVDRLAPFDDVTRRWLDYEFDMILSRIEPVADGDLMSESRRYLTPEGDLAIVADEDSFASSIHSVFVAAPA